MQLVKQILSVWAALSLVTLTFPGATIEAQVAELTVRSSGRDAVRSAIDGHIIGEGRVTGVFERER